MAAMVTAALVTGVLGTTALAQTVPGSVYGIRKAIQKVAEQAKEQLEQKLKQENPGISNAEIKFAVEDKIKEEVKVVVQQKLESTGVKDVSADHWAGSSIAVLVEAGFIQPNAGGQVKPDEGTTVDDTAAIFAKVLGIASKTDTTEEAAAKAEQAGLVRNRTAFDRDMTRIEVAYMLANALGLDVREVSVAEVPFRDFHLMSSSDWGVVTALYEAGIFRGFEDRTFRPNNVLTKAQIAILVDRVLGTL